MNAHQVHRRFRESFGGRVRIGILAALLVAAQAPAVPLAHAEVFTLTDGGSTVSFDLGDPLGATLGALQTYSWVFKDLEHMGPTSALGQGFWYRRALGVPGESELTSLPHSASAMNTNSDPGLDTLTATFTKPGIFTVDITWSLLETLLPELQSTLTETITITNTSASPLDLSFFEYTDFNLAGTADNDTLTFEDTKTVVLKDATLPFRASETIDLPSHHEGEDILTATSPILTRLGDLSSTTLTDLPAPPASLGPGNVAWAFQWDFEPLGAGEMMTIEKTKQINFVPEAGNFFLATLFSAIGACLWRRHH